MREMCRLWLPCAVPQGSRWRRRCCITARTHYAVVAHAERRHAGSPLQRGGGAALCIGQASTATGFRAHRCLRAVVCVLLRAGVSRGAAALGTRARRGPRHRRGRFFSCRRWRAPSESPAGTLPPSRGRHLSHPSSVYPAYMRPPAPFPPRTQGTKLAFVRRATNGVRPLYASPPEINA